MENIGDVWHRALAKRIGEAVAACRKELGLTAQQLAARCGELGVPIHRTTITKIENGRPRFDLGELLVLAAALNTAPVTLVYPGPYQDEVEVLPAHSSLQFYAAQWFTGNASIGFQDGDPAKWTQSTQALRLWRELLDAVRIRKVLIDNNSDAEQVMHYDKQIQRLSEQLGIGDGARLLGLGPE